MAEGCSLVDRIRICRKTKGSIKTLWWLIGKRHDETHRVDGYTGSFTVGRQETPPKGTVERIKGHGKSLEGNLEGDSPDRDVTVYLPPDYAANRNQRYPVVYLL